MGIARKGGGGVKACQDGLGHFFPTLPGSVRACQDDSGHEDLVISLSSIFSFELTFTFGGGMRVETILKLFQSY